RQLLRHHAAPVSRGQLRLVLPPVDRHRRAGAEPVHSTPPGGNGDMAARHKDAGASSARVPALASSRLTAGPPPNAPPPPPPPPPRGPGAPAAAPPRAPARPAPPPPAP